MIPPPAAFAGVKSPALPLWRSGELAFAAILKNGGEQPARLGS